MRFLSPFALRALVVASALSSPALAGGKLKGKVEGFHQLVAEAQAAATKSDAHRFQWREGSPSVKPEFRTKGVSASQQIVVVLLAASRPSALLPVSIALSGLGYLPATWVVAPGTALRFANNDVFPHKPFVVGVPDWKPEPVAPTGRRDWTAPAAGGTFELRDAAFPSARGFLVVEPNVVASASPAADGSFVIDAPAGEYTLRAYFEGKPIGEARPVTLGDGAPTTLASPLPLVVSGATK